jgi:hypothetical protein
MKQLMLALLMVSTMHGMDLLKHRAEIIAASYLYDYPIVNQQWDLNEVVQGKTVLDLFHLTGCLDVDFCEYIRQRGARAAYELKILTARQLPLDRANRMLGHITPTKVS